MERRILICKKEDVLAGNAVGVWVSLENTTLLDFIAEVYEVAAEDEIVVIYYDNLPSLGQYPLLEHVWRVAELSETNNYRDIELFLNRHIISAVLDIETELANWAVGKQVQ